MFRACKVSQSTRRKRMPTKRALRIFYILHRHASAQHSSSSYSPLPATTVSRPRPPPHQVLTIFSTVRILAEETKDSIENLVPFPERKFPGPQNPLGNQKVCLEDTGGAASSSRGESVAPAPRNGRSGDVRADPPNLRKASNFRGKEDADETRLGAGLFA